MGQPRKLVVPQTLRLKEGPGRFTFRDRLAGHKLADSSPSFSQEALTPRSGYLFLLFIYFYLFLFVFVLLDSRY